HGRSLLALEKGAILHRLTQRAMRASMSAEHRTNGLRRVLVVLEKELDDALNPMKLAQHAPFITHAATALDLARNVGPDSEGGNLAVNLANYSCNRADYGVSLAAVEQAEKHYRKAFGNEGVKVATAIGIRGFILRAKGNLDGALQCYVEAERIDRKALG